MARFIVEADGGSRGNPGPAAYGAVVRDAVTGQVLAERAAHIGTSTNNVAEYHGLIAGLTAVRELDPDATVEARLDSKLVVEQMSGRWKVKHPSMRPLAVQAAGILPRDRVTYVWVPRLQNAHADRLANEALDAAARGETWAPENSRAELDAAEQRSRGAAPETTGMAPVTLLLLCCEDSGAAGLRRAQEMAEIVAPAVGAEVAVAPWLRDATVGPPGAEPLDVVLRQVDDALRRLLAESGGSLLVVMDNLPIRLLVAQALGAPLDAVHRMDLSPGSLTEIRWSGGAASLRRFNEAAPI